MPSDRFKIRYMSSSGRIVLNKRIGVKIMEEREQYIVRSIPKDPELKSEQIAVLAAYPTLEKAFHVKLQEGYELLSIKYDADVKAGHEILTITFRKGYERYIMTQSKGPYAGGFSHASFGLEGERGEILT